MPDNYKNATIVTFFDGEICPLKITRYENKGPFTRIWDPLKSHKYLRLHEAGIFTGSARCETFFFFSNPP